ncbi:hypothetical protein DNTS_026617 [Danionella cerebrum]|uniref:Menorin-like domain-containing protein n=1 Tax=Danionella cerebrum TaxID=2873325 RepID=A0A553NKH3_9TELE|nr:hypothetical protein DNTS_026617 [Danionella translucida]
MRLIKCNRLVVCATLITYFLYCCFKLKPNSEVLSSMGEQTLEYFLSKGKIPRKDAADIEWCHAANSKNKLTEALQGSALMIEADVLLRGNASEEPIMAHPPENDSDITLQEWLQEVLKSDKGIKLDFKSLAAVSPSMSLLDEVRDQLKGPVWINADVISGPGGKAVPLDPHGYNWEVVHQMEELCRPLKQPVTFPVRAALLPMSFLQLQWLLEQSDRYSLTIWTGKDDAVNVEDLLPYRQKISKTRIYYDLIGSQMTRFKGLPGYS